MAAGRLIGGRSMTSCYVPAGCAGWFITDGCRPQLMSALSPLLPAGSTSPTSHSLCWSGGFNAGVQGISGPCLLGTVPHYVRIIGFLNEVTQLQWHLQALQKTGSIPSHAGAAAAPRSACGAAAHLGLAQRPLARTNHSLDQLRLEPNLETCARKRLQGAQHTFRPAGCRSGVGGCVASASACM